LGLQALCQNCQEITLEAFPEKCLNLKSKAFHESASEKIPGTLPNCFQKLSWHFAKNAFKNYSSTLPKLPPKAMTALYQTASI
jgi:hypothetical protein